MAALSLHHATFTNKKDSDFSLRSAVAFLHSMPEREESPAGQLLTSATYQDLIQRQPTHPDGPMSGWDLGLNLLGDPLTPVEYKSSGDHQTKMKLRRLHAINVTFELLFGIWGTYTAIRYSLAAVYNLGDAKRVCALVLGIMSALVVALVITSLLMPLFPQRSHPHVWRYVRSLLRACYLLLLSAGAVMNLVLVLIWHPSRLCHWDIDISWYISTADTSISPCHTAPLAAWITAAALRLVVTLTLSILFIYSLHSYYGTRHPNRSGISPKYSPYLSSDPEENAPVTTSSPPRLSKSLFRLARSEDSSHTLNQSITTLPKSNSISTLAPSTSCTGHSRSRSTSQDVSPPRISPPTSRRPSTHTTNHGPETPSQTQPGGAVIPPLSASHMLRRTSRISIAQMTWNPMPSDSTLHSDGSRDSVEIPSSASWKPGHRGAIVHLDVKKTTLAWENTHVRCASQPNVGPGSHDGESVKEKDKDDDVLTYSYGYGASVPTYPYLDMYNPQGPGRYAQVPSSCEDVDERVLPQGYRQAISGGSTIPDAPSESWSSLSKEESSGEEEEYVAMMGGFVRRMATIESLGSREATGTLSTTGSVARHSMRSKTPGSQFSSVRFAEYGSSGGSSLSKPLSRDGSHSTTYLSFSSRGADMWVNERGELLPGPDTSRSNTGSPYDRQYYTASATSFPRVDDEDR